MNSKHGVFLYKASFFLLFLLFASPSIAQKTDAKPTPTPERNREIVAVVQRLYSCGLPQPAFRGT